MLVEEQRNTLKLFDQILLRLYSIVVWKKIFIVGF